MFEFTKVIASSCLLQGHNDHRKLSSQNDCRIISNKKSTKSYEIFLKFNFLMNALIKDYKCEPPSYETFKIKFSFNSPTIKFILNTIQHNIITRRRLNAL